MVTVVHHAGSFCLLSTQRTMLVLFHLRNGGFGRGETNSQIGWPGAFFDVAKKTFISRHGKLSPAE